MGWSVCSAEDETQASNNLVCCRRRASRGVGFATPEYEGRMLMFLARNADCCKQPQEPGHAAIGTPSLPEAAFPASGPCPAIHGSGRPDATLTCPLRRNIP